MKLLEVIRDLKPLLGTVLPLGECKGLNTADLELRTESRLPPKYYRFHLEPCSARLMNVIEVRS